MFKRKRNNSMWLSFKTSRWILGKNMAATGVVQWWTVLPGEMMSSHCWVCVERWDDTCGGVPEGTRSQKEVLALGWGWTLRSPLEGPLNLQHQFLTGSTEQCQRYSSSPVPKEHGSGRGESLLHDTSADKPVNCADCQSEEWKERSKRGNFASNLICLLHRKAHKVTHRPSIPS